MSRKRRARRRAPEPDSPVADQPKTPRPGRHKWQLALLLIIGGGLIAGAIWFYWTTTSSAVLRLPSVEPEGLLPNVAQTLYQAQVKVLDAPDDADAWGTYGLVLLAHGFRREAVTCFQEAERLAPADYRWSYYLGMTQAMFDAQLALQAFERSARKAPERISVRLRLAEWYFDMRQLDRSQTHVDLALQQQPNNARAQLLMARLCAERGDFATARQWAEKAARDPRGNRRDVHELLARVCQRLGDRAAAREHANKAAELPLGVAVWDDPEMGAGATYLQDASVLNALAASSRARGDVDRCLELLYRVVDFDPRNVLWKENLAHALIDCRKYPAALQVLKAGLVAHPESAELAGLQGQVLFAMGRSDAARDVLKRAVQLKPDYDLALELLGRIELAQQRPQGALDYWRRALELRPDDDNLRLDVAELFVKQGDRAAALQQLEQIANNPDNPDNASRVRQLRDAIESAQQRQGAAADEK